VADYTVRMYLSFNDLSWKSHLCGVILYWDHHYLSSSLALAHIM